jgi:predicted RNA polymerase sigma factor
VRSLGRHFLRVPFLLAASHASRRSRPTAQPGLGAAPPWLVLLYDMLLHLAPSPVTRLHRAIALRYTAGPRAAMVELEALAGVLDRYHLYHATRAELLRELGHPDQARAADRLALELTANPAEQAVLQQRIAWTWPPPFTLQTGSHITESVEPGSAVFSAVPRSAGCHGSRPTGSTNALRSA